MAIDPYSTCPGGTGKKLKFCCSDLVGELDKIQRMIEGEQHVACLDYIAKLESKYPERACLMALHSIIELSLEKHDEAAATINAFLRKYPENPLATCAPSRFSESSRVSRRKPWLPCSRRLR